MGERRINMRKGILRMTILLSILASLAVAYYIHEANKGKEDQFIFAVISGSATFAGIWVAYILLWLVYLPIKWVKRGFTPPEKKKKAQKKEDAPVAAESGGHMESDSSAVTD